MDYSLFSDERLVEIYSGGDPAAFEALVRRYSRPLYNFAYRFVGDYDLANEVAQDTLVRLFAALPSRKSDLPIRPLIYRIARNRAIDLLRERKTMAFSALSPADGGETDDDSLAESLPDPTPLPAELAERHDLQRLLGDCIAALPPRYRQVVALRYTTDLTFAEIAAALDVPENTAKTLFQRAKAMLREALRDYS